MSTDENWDDVEPVELADLSRNAPEAEPSPAPTDEEIDAEMPHRDRRLDMRPSAARRLDRRLNNKTLDRRLHPLPGFAQPISDDQTSDHDAEKMTSDEWQEDSVPVTEELHDDEVDTDSSAEYDPDQYDAHSDYDEFDDAETEYEPATAEASSETAGDLVEDDGSYDVIIEPDLDEQPHGLSTRWLAAIVVSLVLHAWMGSTLSSVTIEDREYEGVIPIESRIAHLEPVPEEDEQIVEYELANPNDLEKEQLTSLNAQSVGLVLSEKPVQEAAPQLLEVVSVEMRDVAPAYDIPEGTEVDESIVVQGTNGEGIIQLDAALDRVTWEIAANLKERKVLIVWLLDASGSLKEQRKDVTKRMRRIYGELQALETAGQVPNQDQPVLSAVVSFGLKTTFMTPNPTPKVDDIISALEKAPFDESGVENVFGAVKQVLDKWQGMRTQQGRRILIMTITDEAGDDYGTSLNSSITMLNRLGGKAYVIGPPAIFGKRQGFIPYLAPEDGKTYQIPVDIGPESAMAENVQLPFWFNGPQYDNLSSGLGPYALARLVHETGGAYFMTNMTTSTGLAATGSYGSQTMKMFTPDYKFGTPEEYMRSLNKHPLRQAVYNAGQLSLKYKALGTPNLEMRVTPANYLQILATSQPLVAVSTALIETTLMAFSPKLELEYTKETSLRWRMAYNLCYGRLLAQRLRNYEYNSALAQLKLLGAQDIASKSNHWIFRPDVNINYAAGMKKPKDLAESLLKRCITEAPGTPWAILAARELQYPFGIKVIEQYEKPAPPPPERMDPANLTGKKKGVLLLADDKKKMPTKPAAPPPPPKLPKF
ncbi:MAG: hypothetical protein JWN70_2170 [Planctomycetaceae bacterium]|nr:hypothetical protein [Planctomycetaceae bacterium]